MWGRELLTMFRGFLVGEIDLRMCFRPGLSGLWGLLRFCRPVFGRGPNCQQCLWTYGPATSHKLWSTCSTYPSDPKAKVWTATACSSTIIPPVFQAKHSLPPLFLPKTASPKLWTTARHSAPSIFCNIWPIYLHKPFLSKILSATICPSTHFCSSSTPNHSVPQLTISHFHGFSSILHSTSITY